VHPPLKHLRLQGIATTEPYTSPNRGGAGQFRMPPRDRQAHGTGLIQQFEAAHLAAQTAQQTSVGQTHPPSGVILDFRSDPNFELQVKSLEASNRGIELLNVRQERGATLATVFIPYGRVNYFTSKLEQYLTEHVRGGSQPKNQKLVESISEIRRAVLESFWTDATEVLPRPGQAIWWEVWLRTPSASEVGSNIFRSEANRIGLSVGPRQISFPDRTVLIAFGTREQLAESVELLDVVAELRRAKECPTAFIETTPREQTDWVTSVLTRLTAAPASANAVCVLDTGVNIGH